MPESPALHFGDCQYLIYPIGRWQAGNRMRPLAAKREIFEVFDIDVKPAFYYISVVQLRDRNKWYQIECYNQLERFSFYFENYKWEIVLNWIII